MGSHQPTLFDGKTFDAKLDGGRLFAQLQKVLDLMSDGEWRTLREISEATGCPEASASARLRDARKARWGSRVVERRRRGEETRGLFEYRVRTSN